MLDGRSVTLDPSRHAVRADLADIRLADRVFAPHYAAPVARVVAGAAVLRAERSPASAGVARLDDGAAFELLDVLGDDAWGIAPAADDGPRVGYLALAALREP